MSNQHNTSGHHSELQSALRTVTMSKPPPGPIQCKSFLQLDAVHFPEPTGINVNMMPIVMGDATTVPEDLHGYLSMINQCGFNSGDKVYLSIMETTVTPGTTQRRPGVHTDGTTISHWGVGWCLMRDGGWAGNGYGWEGQIMLPREPDSPYNSWRDPENAIQVEFDGTEGIYMASTDGRCRMWDMLDLRGDFLGAVPRPKGDGTVCKPNTMYWMTDRTPHESLDAEGKEPYTRQWFRLVGSRVDRWFSKHSTANPLGIEPDCDIEDRDKFTGMAEDEPYTFTAPEW
eukprot:m.201473 g.201473  ORF g.201473 m.201473 type:complete len:286 (+) comp18420_c0_seq1:12-869(+)